MAAAAASSSAETMAVAPAYAEDGGPNPVLLLAPGWSLAAGLSGDRGLGLALAGAGRRVLRVPVAGANPDVDTPADLAALEGGRR